MNHYKGHSHLIDLSTSKQYLENLCLISGEAMVERHRISRYNDDVSHFSPSEAFVRRIFILCRLFLNRYKWRAKKRRYIQKRTTRVIYIYKYMEALETNDWMFSSISSLLFLLLRYLIKFQQNETEKVKTKNIISMKQKQITNLLLFLTDLFACLIACISRRWKIYA